MKKIVKFTTACLFLAGLAGCSVPGAAPLEEASVNENAIDQQEERGLILPEIDGVTITPSIKNPRAGDFVTFTVMTNPLQKRIESVKFNGQVLSPLSVNGPKAVYGVEIPTDGANKVDIVAVDLFGISVADDVKDILVLTGLKEKVAAEGDVVEFAPGAVPGYWFAGVTAVDEDVTLAPVDGKTGWYSFVMPGHAVSLSCVTGKNVYHCNFSSNPKFKMNAGTAEEEELTLWSISGLTDTKYYEAGEQVKFKVSKGSPSYDVADVKVDGVSLVKDSSDYYSFTMPGGNPDIQVSVAPIYHSYSIGECDSSYIASLKTLDANGQEVDVTDSNVVAGQAIRLYVNNTNTDPHYTPTFEFKTGSALDSLYKDSITVRYDEAGGYYVFKAPSLAFTVLNLVKKFHLTSADAQVGEYSAGYKTNNGGNYYAKINEQGQFMATSSSVSAGTTPNYYSFNMHSLVFDDESDLSHATMEGASDSLYFGDDVMLRISSSDKSGTYLYAKGKGNCAYITNGADGTHTYSYYVPSALSPYKIGSEFLHMETTTGDIVTAFYDFDTNKAVLGATTTVIKGADGFTKGDRILISAPNGDALAVYDFDTKETSYYNGYQHKVSNVAFDGYQGTYAPADEAAGTGSLEVTGYNIATLNGVQGTYLFDNGVFVFTPGEGEVSYFRLDKDAKTYAASAAPTDATEGTYTGAEGEFVSDGYGHCTLNGVAGTYVTGDGVTLVVTVEDVEHYLVVDKYARTFVAVGPYAITYGSPYTFVDDGENGYKSNNSGKSYSSAEITIKVYADVDITVTFLASSEARYDYFGCKVDDVEKWSKTDAGASGNNTVPTTKTIHVSAGQVVKFFYSKDSSGDNGSDCVWIKTLMVGSDYIIGSAE